MILWVRDWNLRSKFCRDYNFVCPGKEDLQGIETTGTILAWQGVDWTGKFFAFKIPSSTHVDARERER
jgi:hypothetical protein